MSKFKVGPAKTRDGREAFVFEISDKIYAKAFGTANTWSLMGCYMSDGEKHKFDLMPNTTEPLRERFNGHLVYGENLASEGTLAIAVPNNTEFNLGDKLKVTLERIDG